MTEYILSGIMLTIAVMVLFLIKDIKIESKHNHTHN